MVAPLATSGNSGIEISSEGVKLNFQFWLY